MAKRIKGITIELDGETRGLDKALSDVNKRSRDLQSELRDVERLLKFNPGNVEALAQKQQLLTKQIENTSEKLYQLKSAQQQVQQQFERGEIGEEQYRSFRRELEFTEGSLTKLKSQLSGMQQEQERVSRSTKQLETLFQATGTSVDDFSDALGNKLTRAIKTGTASSKQLDDAINKIGVEALGTRTDLDKMKQTLDSADDGKSIQAVRKDLQKLSKDADDAKGAVKEMGSEISGIVGGLAAGGGIAGIVDQALDVSSLQTKINISFNVPPESVKSVKEAINTVSSYGVDAEEALEGVRRQWALNADASDDANSKITKGAAVIASSYSGIDFTELIQEINEMASELNISNEEALGLADSLLKAGFPPEQFDTIAEYGNQLSRVGFEAEEIQAIFAAGVDVKSWNIDNLIDGIKEGRILLAEFGAGIDDTTKEILKGTGISAKQLQSWGKSAAKGGEEGKKAMFEVSKALNNVEDATKKNELGVKIFGTMWEDQGQNILDVLLNSQNATFDLQQGVQGVNDNIAKMDADPAVQFNKAISDLKVALVPLLTSFAEFVSKIAEWIQQNPELAATLMAIATTAGILVGLFAVLAPLVSLLAGAATALGIGLAPLIGIIAGIVAGIALLVGGFVLAYQKIEWFREMVNLVWEFIKESFSNALAFIKALVTGDFEGMVEAALNQMENMSQFLSGIWEVIKEIYNSALKWLAEKLGVDFETMKGTVDSVLTTTWEIIKRIWDWIKESFKNALDFVSALLEGDFEGMYKAVSKQMENIDDTVKDIWGKVEKFFEDIDLKEVGKNIIEGLIKGIGSMKDSLKKKAQEMAGTVVKAMTKRLDTHSPSKVTEEIGEWAGEGVEKGLISMIRRVKMAGERLAAASIPTKRNIPVFGVNERSGSDTRGETTQPVNMARMFEGANFYVREEQDIQKIARELFRLQESNRRVILG